MNAGRYSLVEATRVEQGPPPSQRLHPRAPWWAGWILAVIGALGGGETARRLLASSAEQTALLVEIKAELKHARERADRLELRMDAAEKYAREDHTRDEVAFATIAAALAKEGYQVRGIDHRQVDFASTANARKPVQAVSPDGRELEVPPPATPPRLQ